MLAKSPDNRPIDRFLIIFSPKQRFTAGYDCWIVAQSTNVDRAEAELKINGNTGDLTTVLYVAGDGEWQAEYNGKTVECAVGVAGCLEISLPKNSSGKLVIYRK